MYRLCALGELRHIRVLNAITMAPSDVDALVGPEPTQLTAGLEVSSCGNRQGPSFVNGSEPQADRQPRLSGLTSGNTCTPSCCFSFWL